MNVIPPKFERLPIVDQAMELAALFPPSKERTDVLMCAASALKTAVTPVCVITSNVERQPMGVIEGEE